MDGNHDKFRSNILLLYELSLATGRSLDLSQTCREFLEILMARVSLSYCSVWLSSAELHSDPNDVGYELVYAIPDARTHSRYLEVDHPVFRFVPGQRFRCISSDDPEFMIVATEGGVETGAYALFSLDGLGVLKLYSVEKKVFSLPELKALWAVVEKFSVAIRGALAYRRLQIEVVEREQAERFLDLLLQLASRFINLPLDEIDDSIQKMLGEMGNFIGADGGHIFEYDARAEVVFGAFEWYAPGIEPDRHRLQGMLLHENSTLCKGEVLDIPDVQMLPGGPLREMLETLDIKGLLAFPLMEQSECKGFVGFHAVHHHPLWEDKVHWLLELFASILVNIAERRRIEERLRLDARVFTHASEGILLTDAQGVVLEINEAFMQITGYSREEVVGHHLDMLQLDLHDPVFYSLMWKELASRGRWEREVWCRKKNGDSYALLFSISAVVDPGGAVQNHVVLFTDITQQKHYQRQLERAAYYDPLTGLPNRALLSDRLQQAMGRARRHDRHLALVYLDLDGFKLINDKHGHHVGDKLLKVLAFNLKEVLRESDTIARMGGDEFVVVLEDLAGPEECQPFLARLLLAASRTLPVNGLSLKVSATLGVTLYPQEEDVEADQLLRQADQAMYQAKLKGKNQHQFFDPREDRAVRGMHDRLKRIRDALVGGELELHYQPIVNLRTGHILGVEALIRWRHPQAGLLFPDSFLPEIQNHPLDVEMGEWVIRTALNHLEVWRKSGLDLSVSVNLSAHQLEQSDFTSRLRSILEDYPWLPPGKLTIEILETGALENLTQMVRIIEDCGQLGVLFALDDFGTGYASLAYLKSLPVEKIKVDRDFVRNMQDDPDDLSIVEGVVGLATAFRRSLIAEGVETVEQGRMLLQLGCELAQGYAIARPMPKDQVPAWIGSWRPADPDWTCQRLLLPSERPLLFATAEHRALMRHLERVLKQQNPGSLHELDWHQCRFGHWLDTEGLMAYREHPVFLEIRRIHEQLHRFVAQTLRSKGSGDLDGAQSGLEKCFEMQSRFESLLSSLVNST